MSFWSDPAGATHAAITNAEENVREGLDKVSGALEGKALVSFENPVKEELEALGRLAPTRQNLSLRRSRELAEARLRASGLSGAAAATAGARLYNRGFLGSALTAADTAARLSGVRHDLKQGAAQTGVRDDFAAFMGGM
jgi:hypothetical protein